MCFYKYSVFCNKLDFATNTFGILCDSLTQKQIQREQCCVVFWFQLDVSCNEVAHPHKIRLQVKGSEGCRLISFWGIRVKE